MGELRIDFPDAVGVPAGNNLEWAGVLDNDNLAPGQATGFHVELTRPIAAGPLPAPGANLSVFKLPPAPPVTIDPPGPDVGSDLGNEFAAGQMKTIDFQITNAITGVNPAAYFIFAVVS
jgi:hypothetical protein